jgi:hypothetical protein
MSVLSQFYWQILSGLGLFPYGQAEFGQESSSFNKKIPEKSENYNESINFLIIA